MHEYELGPFGKRHHAGFISPLELSIYRVEDLPSRSVLRVGEILSGAQIHLYLAHIIIGDLEPRFCHCLFQFKGRERPRMEGSRNLSQ
jgi:hypothetical protein